MMKDTAVFKKRELEGDRTTMVCGAQEYSCVEL